MKPSATRPMFTSETDLGPTLDYEAVGDWIEKACKPLGASIYIELWEEILRLNELMGVAQGEHDRLESEVLDLAKRLDKCVDKNYNLAEALTLAKKEAAELEVTRVKLKKTIKNLQEEEE